MQAEKDSEPQADSFAEVFQNELGEIKKRRRQAGYNESDSEALDGNLVGLALSGGGIRSATFCLGLLQGLRHLKLLHMFDYISTVSGGGYIGGWWSAWLSRNRIELRRKARSVKFKVDHIKSPAHLAVSLRFPETRISEYIFKKLNAGTQDLLKKHCVPKAAPPSHLSHVLERALSEEPEFKFFESLPEDAKRYLKHYCRPDRAASEALAKVLVYELNELLKDPSILQNILKSGRVVEQLLDDSELMEFLRSLPYQNSDSCVVPVSEEREIVERWAEKSGAPGDEEKRLKQDEGYNSLSLLNQIAANIKTLNDQEEEGNQITWDIQWINRSLLETIYPNEIGRDIFPPPEKTELQRQSDYASDINSNHNGSTKQSAIPERKSAGKDPIHHLRLYANYLTPRKGILSGDTWRLIAVAARNLGLTWLIMLPMLFAILLAGQLYFVLQENPPGYYVDPNPKNTLQGEKYAEYRRIGHRIKIERALINQLLDSRAMCLGDLDEISKKKRGYDVLKPIDDAEGQVFAPITELRNRIIENTEKRMIIKEHAREVAMSKRLEFLGWGLAPFAGWIAVLGFLYLILSLEPERLSEWVMIGLSLAVAFAVVYCLILAGPEYFKKLRGSLERQEDQLLLGLVRAEVTEEGDSPDGSSKVAPIRDDRQVVKEVLMAIWALIAIGLVVYPLMIKRNESLGGKEDRLRRWEAYRNRATLIHVRLMVMLVVWAVVLSIAGFGHELFNVESYRFGNDSLAFSGWLVAAIAAVVCLALVIYWARAKEGNERRSSGGQPTLVSLILAITPSLVIIVLAITIAWLSHKSLEMIHDIAKPSRPMGRVVYFTIAAYIGILISLVCAVFETKGLIKHRAYSILVSIFFGGVAGSLLWHSLKLLATTKMPAEDSASNSLLISAAIFAILLFITLMRFKFKLSVDRNSRTILLLGFSLITLFIYLGLSFVPRLGADHLSLTYAKAAFGLLVLSLTWVIALGWMADPNAYSMHIFYKVRLVRAYLGASNNERSKYNKEITEPDTKDDVPLLGLKNCEKGAPYHLINTTLNLTAARDLKTAQRSAESFVLSHLHCGSLRTGYHDTDKYMKGRLSLGTAVAVSGAAASPNMGSRTPTAALAMIMTLFNIRLGYWAPTPNRRDWQSPRARLWPFYLFREFLSRTNDLSNYCYLTDGAHFDNTGIYSLVQRGCRFIVAADCGEDPKTSFSDLGDLIRRCRIDFGAEIDLDIRPFILNNGKGLPHYVVGEITYKAEYISKLNEGRAGVNNEFRNNDDLKGTIILFKPSIPEQKLADVRQYKIDNPVFPQESTVNQWFDEAQFESYRLLGRSCAQNVFEKLCEKTNGQQKSHVNPNDGNACSLDYIKTFFEAAPANQVVP